MKSSDEFVPSILTWRIKKRLSLSPTESLSSTQEQLLDLMLDISELGYCACWMANLEYDLWSAIDMDCFEYGFLMLNAELRQLKKLSAESDGWFYFDIGRKKIAFASTEEWKRKYDDFVRKNDSGI